jgi:hypothetical protein
MNLALSTMTKNQGSRLEEWILYHRNLGHEKFIIFLDECSDNSEEILKKLKSNNVDIDYFKTEIDFTDLMRLHWIDRSHEVYNYVLANYSQSYDWISFIELDEFIFPQKKGLDFKSFLSNLSTNCYYINSWDLKPPFDENEPILGQSYYVWTDEQRYNSIYTWRGKSIIKPKEFVKCMDAHHFLQKNNLVSQEFKTPHQNYLQKNYGDEVVIDDYSFRIYHFRNHTDAGNPNRNMVNYIQITY